MRFSTLVLPKRHPRPSARPCDDRLEVSGKGDACAVLVADGATGAGDGWKASARMAEVFLAGCWGDPTASGMADLIRAADSSLLREHGGDVDTTAVVLVVSGGRVMGASAGDSQAYLVVGDEWRELTQAQARKPRVGNGARPVCFEAAIPPGASIVAATDGLWGQVAFGDVRRAFRGVKRPDGAVEALAAVVTGRWPAGLPDDLGIAVGMPVTAG